MNNVNLIPETLKSHIKWYGARLSFLALFLISLFRVKTVNLAELSTGFMEKAKTPSNYKRLQRFLREFDLDYYTFAKLVIEIMSIPEPWVLSIDRTEWKFEVKVFNILTLGVVHQGFAFPLLWWMLGQIRRGLVPVVFDSSVLLNTKKTNSFFTINWANSYYCLLSTTFLPCEKRRYS